MCLSNHSTGHIPPVAQWTVSERDGARGGGGGWCCSNIGHGHRPSPPEASRSVCETSHGHRQHKHRQILVQILSYNQHIVTDLISGMITYKLRWHRVRTRHRLPLLLRARQGEGVGKGKTGNAGQWVIVKRRATHLVLG